MIKVPPLERFWSKVSKSDGCWEWTAGVDVDGYGRFKSNGKTEHATRFLWRTLFGEITSTDFVLHSCDNPKCVRPDHLTLGDHRKNMEHMRSRKRSMWGTRSHLTKLSEDAVRKIRTTEGRHADIAMQFGVCKATITHIKNGRNWANLI